jgi:hypothetical protein
MKAIQSGQEYVCPVSRAMLMDGETLELFNEAGVLVAEVEIGVSTQKPERQISVRIPKNKVVDTLILLTGQTVIITPKQVHET